MARRRGGVLSRGFRSLSGPGRIGYGAAAIGAGVSKVGFGLHRIARGVHAGTHLVALATGKGAILRRGGIRINPVEVGKGLIQTYSGVRHIRSGFRNIRGVAGSQAGHPFYGNQFTRVQRTGRNVGAGYANRGRSGYYPKGTKSRYGYVSKPRRRR